MSKVFLLTVIEEKKKKKKVIFRNQLTKLNFDETFESNITNELDFHGYDTVEIEIQQQSDDINHFTCELHQTLYGILEFNPALKVINITLVYENDENDIDLGVVEKKDGSKLFMTSAREKSGNRFLKIPEMSCAESKVA